MKVFLAPIRVYEDVKVETDEGEVTIAIKERDEIKTPKKQRKGLS